MHLQQSECRGIFSFSIGVYSKMILSLRFVSAFVKCLALQLPTVIRNLLLTYTGKKSLEMHSL